MARSFRLEVVTPEKVVFSEEVTSVVAPAHEGYLGVLAGHAPLVCVLRPGTLAVAQPSGTRFFATSGGFMEVGPARTVVLSEAVEGAREIDVARAEKARDRARERLATPADAEQARGALSRALNRITVSRKHAK